jgi:hypothetical protein
MSAPNKVKDTDKKPIGNEATQFQKGNQFWKARSTHGRNPIYSNPQDLQDAIEQYFEWVHQNPLIEYKPMIEQGLITNAMIPKPIPMTITSCQRFCGLSHTQWAVYKANTDFTAIIEQAEYTIRDHKLIGASVGFFNANIIARELGLKEASDVNINATVNYKEMSDDDLDRKIEDLSA